MTNYEFAWAFICLIVVGVHALAELANAYKKLDKAEIEIVHLHNQVCELREKQNYTKD